MKKALKVIISSLLLLITILAIDKFSFYIGRLIYPLFERFDSDNVFMVLLIHHILQMLIALLIIFLIVKLDKTSISNRGFNFNDFGYSLIAAAIFSFIYLLVQYGALYYAINYTDYVHGLPYFPTKKNIVGLFSFNLFLTGTSEEIVFRVLPLSALLLVTKDSIDDKKFKILFAIVNVIIFMFGHVGYTIIPFKIVYFSVLQQINLVIFGVFYSWLFLKTKSIVGSMIAHGVLNIIIISSQLIFYLAYI